jgi:hypothetical protein
VRRCGGTGIPFSDGNQIASGNSLIMHFLGHVVLALAIIIAAMIIAFAFRFTPVVTRGFAFGGAPVEDHVRSFGHWTVERH